MREVIVLAIVSTILAVLVTLLAVALANQYRIKENLQKRLFQSRAGLYSAFMEKWVEIMLEKPDPEKISREFKEFIGKFKLMLILYASDEVYKSFVRLMKKSESNMKINLHDLGDIFLAMRKDLRSTQLGSIDLLASFITDIEKHAKPGEWPPDWLKDVLSNPLSKTKFSSRP